MLRPTLGLAAAFLAAPLAAQPPAPAPAPARASAPPWQVDWGEHYCTMIRHPGEGRPFATAFVVVPGGLSTEIMLLPEGDAVMPRRADRVVLMPGGQTFEVTPVEERRGARSVLRLSGNDFRLRDRLAEASELRIQRGNEVYARVPLDGVRAAVTAHRRCTADISRQWRVDEAVLTALRRLPDTTNRLGFTPDDYPTGALAARTQGRVSMRLTVTPQGRTGDCAVVVSSGSPAIDERSCRVAMRRGRFHPALDAAGRPVAVATIYTVTWVIPGG